VSGVEVQDAVLVEALLRLQLTARRLGGRIRLHRPSQELLDLLVGAGLLLALEPPQPLDPP
jgi:hypothetical protein